MSKDRRSHSKVTTELPPEIIEQVNRLLTTPGKTYQDIVDFLHEQGFSVSHSSIGRYGKDFLSRLERLRIVREQAKTIIQDMGDQPTTELSEAANQIAVQLIMETLMKVDNLDNANLTELLKALAGLEKSGVARERLKLDFRDRVKQTADKVKNKLKRSKVPQEIIDMIEHDILGVIR